MCPQSTSNQHCLNFHLLWVHPWQEGRLKRENVLWAQQLPEQRFRYLLVTGAFKRVFILVWLCQTQQPVPCMVAEAKESCPVLGDGERQAGQGQGWAELPSSCPSTAWPAPGGTQNSGGGAWAGTPTPHRLENGELGTGKAMKRQPERRIDNSEIKSPIMLWCFGRSSYFESTE